MTERVKLESGQAAMLSTALSLAAKVYEKYVEDPNSTDRARQSYESQRVATLAIRDLLDSGDVYVEQSL